MKVERRAKKSQILLWLVTVRLIRDSLLNGLLLGKRYNETRVISRFEKQKGHVIVTLNRENSHVTIKIVGLSEWRIFAQMRSHHLQSPDRFIATHKIDSLFN